LSLEQNGSGKTTLTSGERFFREIPLLDPDNIAATLQSSMPSTFPITAARSVLKSAKEHISRRESFAVETTLAGKHYLRMMVDARNRGFEVVLVTSAQKMLRSTWLESEIEFSRVAMMSRRAMSADVTSEASRVF